MTNDLTLTTDWSKINQYLIVEEDAFIGQRLRALYNILPHKKVASALIAIKGQVFNFEKTLNNIARSSDRVIFIGDINRLLVDFLIYIVFDKPHRLFIDKHICIIKHSYHMGRHSNTSYSYSVHMDDALISMMLQTYNMPMEVRKYLLELMSETPSNKQRKKDELNDLYTKCMQHLKNSNI